LRRALHDVLRNARPELIHVHECFTTLSAPLLASLRGFAPVVGTLHDVRPFCYLMTRRFAPTGSPCNRRCGIACFASGCIRPQRPGDLLRLPRRWATDRLNLREWRRLKRVVVPSTYMRELALQHGIAAAGLRVIPHDTTVPSAPPPWNGRPLPALVVYVGSLRDYKGPALLVEALARIRERPWQAILVGEGPMRGPVEKAVVRHGLQERIRLWGHVSDRTRIEELLGRARLLALPSLIPESFGLAGIEALAMGTPVVSFGLGGVSDWLRDGDTGLVAADGDIEDLARKLDRLLDDRLLAEGMGKRGHALVAERFAAGTTVERLLAVYQEALEVKE
jgi:glycosyltransferase involved in cell wall biosynthesis